MNVLLWGTALAVTALSSTSARWAPAVSLTLLAAVTFSGAFRASKWRVPSIAWWIAGASLVGIIQVAVGISLSGVAALQETVEWLIIAGVVATFTSLFDTQREREKFLLFFAAAAGVIAAFALIQPFLGQLGIAHLAASADEMVGPFRNRNTYAAFAELAFPVAIWAACRVGPEWWLPAVALLTSALVTGSRAGAALIIAEAIVLAAWFRNRRVAAAFAAVVVVSIVFGGDALRTRIGYHDPLEHRRDIYASSLELVSKKPFLGWGLGSFESAYPQEARFDVGAVVDHAHSDLLEGAVEGGLFYVAAAAGCGLLILWQSRRTPWALGLAAVLLHSFVDFPFQRIGVSIWFFLLVPAVWAERTGPTASPPEESVKTLRPTRFRVRQSAGSHSVNLASNTF